MGGGLTYDNVTVGSFILSTSVFIGINLFYGMMDLTGRPAFLYKYKIQGEHVRSNIVLIYWKSWPYILAVRPP